MESRNLVSQFGLTLNLQWDKHGCSIMVGLPDSRKYKFDGILVTPVAEDLQKKPPLGETEISKLAGETLKKLTEVPNVLSSLVHNAEDGQTGILIKQELNYVKPKVRQNYSFEGLWYCRSSNKFVTVRNRIGTVYDENGKDLGIDKVEIDNRGFVDLSIGFLDYCWGGNEKFVKGTTIPWPRGENFDSFAPSK